LDEKKTFLGDVFGKSYLPHIMLICVTFVPLGSWKGALLAWVISIHLEKEIK
jgi:hypothetical protein